MYHLYLSSGCDLRREADKVNKYDFLFSVALEMQWCKYSEDCHSPLNFLFGLSFLFGRAARSALLISCVCCFLVIAYKLVDSVSQTCKTLLMLLIYILYIANLYSVKYIIYIL